ncbi:hypothetical protein [Veillonella caviae]|uniref:hypothetical protein n=1 Tax=Veillonella caviae TaxID=248316 RepID=UPI0023EF5D56|nr:hypothetical protein [Veillonella caviae]MCI6406824.1 hypothetical protein [Veillonella caviae]MDY6224864.1 hypothetical protein [Veillonella caviae]
MLNMVVDTKYSDETPMFGLPSGVKAQHTYVWNDGVPRFLLDVELNNNHGVLAFTTRDSKNEYIHSIEYPLNDGEYTKAQLKYMIMDVQIANTGQTFEGQQMFI